MSSSHVRKQRRLSPSEPQKGVKCVAGNIEAATNQALVSMSQWDLEQGYENSARGVKRKAKDAGRLPIKTSEGKIKQLQTFDAEEFGSNVSINSVSDTQEEFRPLPAMSYKNPLSERQQIMEAKETLARVAILLSEAPEEHAGGFRTLAQIAGSPNTAIKKLALASQAAVFEDVIPGYRIRPISEDISEKLSKETRRLQAFEQTLAKSYHSYVKDLARYATSKPEDVPEGISTVPAVATACACSLLLAAPHFNFRTDLLQIVVKKLGGSSTTRDFSKCRETLESLFENDDDGKPSLDAVTALSKMMRARNYNVDETVLDTFLRLRLLSEFSFKGSQNAIDKPTDRYSDKTTKKPKMKKEFLTKKQRKLFKERKLIEKDYREADAIVGQEERDKLQSETLKIVFVTYFRILKTRSTLLMGSVLEGLAKYAQLINQDFFADLLEVLKDISARAEEIGVDQDNPNMSDPEAKSQSSKDARRSSLLCATTAFALLEGQDVRKSASDLQLDLSFFVSYLYRNLHALATDANLERSAEPSYARDSHQSNQKTGGRVNVQTTSALFLRVLKCVLLPSPFQALSSIPKLRVAAFTKQAMVGSLQVPEKSALAILNLIIQVSKVHGKKINGLWNTEESKGDGLLDLAGERGIEGSNVFMSTIWEGEMLRFHFCPTVRDSIHLLGKVL